MFLFLHGAGYQNESCDSFVTGRKQKGAGGTLPLALARPASPDAFLPPYLPLISSQPPAPARAGTGSNDLNETSGVMNLTGNRFGFSAGKTASMRFSARLLLTSNLRQTWSRNSARSAIVHERGDVPAKRRVTQTCQQKIPWHQQCAHRAVGLIFPPLFCLRFPPANLPCVPRTPSRAAAPRFWHRRYFRHNSVKSAPCSRP